MTEHQSAPLQDTPPRCRPGDLAIVVSAIHKKNLGLVVTVIETDRGKAHVVYPLSTGPVWTCECSIPMFWRLGKKTFRRRRGPVPDSQLKPIRGDKDPDASGGQVADHNCRAETVLA